MGIGGGGTDVNRFKVYVTPAAWQGIPMGLLESLENVKAKKIPRDLKVRYVTI